jgi:chromosome segregation ATPase
MELAEKDERLAALEGNMEGLQESFNETTERFTESTQKEKSLEQKLTEAQSVSEQLSDEVTTLRKKLVLESKGLSWQKHSPLLEGCSTEREMLDKLKSISHLSGANVNRLDTKKVLETLTEGQIISSRNNRLAGIISRV